MKSLSNLIQSLLPSSGFKLTPEFKQAFQLLESTQANYFLTGNAGTGKSTLIHYFRTHTAKKVAVLAPTGLAAINVRGQTIHSFFQFPPRLLTPDILDRQNIRNRIYRYLDTIIIDEASMVRADMLDTIDLFLRRHGRAASLPFGGTQLILVGDLFQLPPVVTSAEQPVLGQLYDTPYFFSSTAFQNARFSVIELEHIFRQQDPEFITLLNHVRTGQVSSNLLDPINSRRQKPRHRPSHRTLTLTTTNQVADTINSSRLQYLSEQEFQFPATVEGQFPTQENYVPVPLTLILRKHARVMFVKNGGQWVNGSLGEVVALDQGHIQVKLDDTGETVAVEPETWEHIKYQYNPDSDKLEEKAVGSLQQYPLRLAWAITIHKSQGMTFDRVNLDFSHSPFAHGQTYVALSRCRSIKGLTLSQEIFPNDVIVDDRIIDFLKLA